MEETNINSENQEEVQDDSEQTESEASEDTEETADQEVTEESPSEEVPFDKHPRWKELKADMSSLRSENSLLKEQIESVQTLMSKQSTAEERDEAWDKIRKLDTDGFTSYEDMAKNLVDVVRAQVEKGISEKEHTKADEKRANIRAIQQDLADLQDGGLLAKEEVQDFIVWCADKLDETRDESHPQGNTAIYGDPKRALSYYRHYQTTTKADLPAKNRLERASIGSSETSATKSQRISLSELEGMDMREVLSRRSTNKN